MGLRHQIRTLVLNYLWLSVLIVATPWLLYRMLVQGKNRRGWKQKLFGLVPIPPVNSRGKRIWLHAVSVGEVHVLQTLVGQLESRNADLQLFISTSTETGFDRAREIFGEQRVFFFPFDFSWAIRNVIQRIRPDLLVLAELELWPNLIHIAAQQGLPLLVANGRLSENSHRNYRRFGLLMRPMFQSLTQVAAQDETYAKRFVVLGCDSQSVTTSGNLKYDAIETDRGNAKTTACREVAANAGLNLEAPIFVAGSTQIEDERAAVEAWVSLRDEHPELQLILVPRHPSRVAETIELLKEHQLTANRRSLPETRHETPILIVDVIGELSGWWGMADIAFVGGSMGSRGGQNMIEPAAFGVPVCFGPNTANFKSTVDGLLSADAARVVEDASELSAFVSQMLKGRDQAEAIGSRARAFVLQHQGAGEQTVDLILEMLSGANRQRSKQAA